MGKGIVGILTSNLILYITAFAITWYTRFYYNEIFQAFTGFLAIMTIVGMVLRRLGKTDTKFRKCMFVLVHLGQCLIALGLCIYASIYTADHCVWNVFHGFTTTCEYRISICVIYFLAFAGEVGCMKAVKSEENQQVEPAVVTQPAQTVVVVQEPQTVQLAPAQTYPVHTVVQPAPVTVSQPAPNVQYLPVVTQNPQ